MKKFVSILLSLIILCSIYSFPICTFAQETQYIKAEAPSLPKCSPKPEKVMFRAVSNPIENILLNAWENVSEDAINILSYRLTLDDVSEIFFNLLYSHPEYYYVETFSYILFGQYIKSIEVNYIEIDPSVIARTYENIEKATDDIMIYIDDDMTDFEKVMTVHNRMIAEYDYNYDATAEDYDTTKGDFDIRIMVKKTGVCQGYALAFKYVMDMLSIDCIFARSDAMCHGWNLVKVDGNWYHIDLTWDDLGKDYFTGIQNTYALLSDNAIQNLDSPHYSYDSAGAIASSTTYDNAQWRYTHTPVISIDGISYYLNGNTLVSSIGEEIYKGFGYWDFEKPDGTAYQKYFVGLFEHNGMLYFNSGTNVYRYNPKLKKTETIDNRYPISNINIVRNNLEVMIFDTNTKTNVKSASVLLSDARIGKPVIENGKIKIYIYKENTEPLNILRSLSDKTELQKLEKCGMSKIYFDNASSAELFYWDNKMHPLRDKEILNID